MIDCSLTLSDLSAVGSQLCMEIEGKNRKITQENFNAKKDRMFLRVGEVYSFLQFLKKINYKQLHFTDIILHLCF